jgi:hypothetical protein
MPRAFTLAPQRADAETVRRFLEFLGVMHPAATKDGLFIEVDRDVVVLGPTHAQPRLRSR